MNEFNELKNQLGVKDVRLNNLLRVMEKDTIIGITAERGSAFMFIGTVADALENLNNIFEKYKADRKYNGERAKEESIQMVKETSKWLSDLERKIEKGEAIKKPLDREEEIYKYSFEIARRVNTVKRTDKYLKEYAKVLYRKVVNVERPDDPNSDKDYIITISGAEIGRYWFKKEFETGIIER